MTNEYPDQNTNESLRAPANVRLGFRFESHSIFDRSVVPGLERSLREQAEATFSRTADNVVFFENTPTDPAVGLLAEGAREYQSFRVGFAYMSFVGGQGRRPNKGEVSRYIRQVSGFFDGLSGRIPPDFRDPLYFWTVYGVLDGLLKNGYKIKPVFENGLSVEEMISEKLRMGVKSVGEYRLFKEQLERETRQRDACMATQLTDLADKFSRKKGPTRIFALLGLSHSNLAALMPASLQPIVQTTLSPISGLPDKIVELNELLKNGKEVPPALWRDTYHQELALMKG